MEGGSVKLTRKLYCWNLVNVGKVLETGERRCHRRVAVHIPAKIIDPESKNCYYGYLEDICGGGAQISLIDTELPPTELVCYFHLGDGFPVLRVTLVPVYQRIEPKKVLSYGLKFTSINVKAAAFLEKYLQTAEKGETGLEQNCQAESAKELNSCPYGCANF